METSSLIALGSLVLIFGLVSKRVQMSPLTPPIVFAAFGLAVAPEALGWVHFEEGAGAVHAFAELTLILVLFLDASRIDLSQLRRGFQLPLRLLTVGMPLTLAAGTLVAVGLFPHFGWLGAALLAAILMPTDAALGQAVVSAPVVPVRIRQTLNVESGLNDGLALPVVLILAAMAETAGDQGFASWAGYTAKQLTFGPLAGVAVGYLGGKTVDRASKTGWMNHSFQQLSGLALALIAFAGAEAVGGNGFIAAFVAGLTMGNTYRTVCEGLYEFTEVEGQLLVLVTFSLFGAALVWPTREHWSTTSLLYAVLSLTVIRILPVALSLLGAGLRPVTTLFLGWFGPRGLASILFGLLIVESSQIPHADEIFSLVVLAVLLSILLHGVTAAPLARRYGDYLASLRERRGELGEHIEAAEHPVRVSMP